MAILSGRYGKVLYDPAGITPVEIISINSFKMNQKSEKIEVTCFGDTNKVYVPGQNDCTGEFGGFWNSAERVLWAAVDATTPGLLQLMPNSTEPTFFWEGLAWLDADIDTSVTDAPKITGSFSAAASWTMEPPFVP
jgi:hypothetical protein